MVRRTGVVLVVAGVVLRFLLPTPLRILVVSHMSRHVSVCVSPVAPAPCLSYGPVDASAGVGTALIWDLTLLWYQM